MSKSVEYAASHPGLPNHARLRELLAASDDPTPRKTVRIEWVGERSPFDNPSVIYGLLNKTYTNLQVKALRMAAAQANTRGGKRRRLLESGNDRRSMAPVPGLQKTYIWEAKTGYMADVDIGDADIILGLPCAREFRLVEEPGNG